MEAIVNPVCTMIGVSGRMKKEKPLSVNDLHVEINALKLEVVQLWRRIETLELANDKDNDDIDLELKLFEDSEFHVGESLNTPNECLNVIEQTISCKYVLKIKLVINLEFTLETLALANTGANRNIIRDGLIPTGYYEKATQALFVANDQKIKIRYKLYKIIVCINDVSL